MGCGISTVEGWEERLSSLERNRRIRVGSERSASTRSAQPTPDTRPFRRSRERLPPVPESEFEVEEAPHEFHPIVAVARAHTTALLKERLASLPEEQCAEETSFRGLGSATRKPTTLPQPMVSGRQLSSMPDDREKRLSFDSFAPPGCITEVSDDNESSLQHHSHVPDTSTESNGADDNNGYRLPETSRTAQGALDLDDENFLLAHDRFARETSSRSAATSDGEFDMEQNFGCLPHHPFLRVSSRLSCLSSSTYNSALDATEMTRAKQEANALRKFCAISASILTSVIEDRRASFESMP